MESEAKMLARLEQMAVRSWDTNEAAAIHWAVEQLALTKRYRAALKPFAHWANRLDAPPNWMPDGCPLTVNPASSGEVTVGHLRAARTALPPDPPTMAEILASGVVSHSREPGFACWYDGVNYHDTPMEAYIARKERLALEEKGGTG